MSKVLGRCVSLYRPNAREQQQKNDSPPPRRRFDLHQFVEQWAQHQPKGVPRHVRQAFDYFIFTVPASPKPEEESTIPEFGGTAGTTPAPAAASLGQDAAGDEVCDDGSHSVHTASTEISAAAAVDEAEKVGTIALGSRLPRGINKSDVPAPRIV